jgi:type II secretory pathway component PulK
MHKPRRQAGYALAIVMLLAIVAGLAVATLMGRQSETRLSVQRQVTGYESHHWQQGLRELIQFWLTVMKRAEGSKLSEATVGFDMELRDGYIVEIRLIDGQSQLLRSMDFSASGTPNPMDVACDNMFARGLASRETMRLRGPAKVSIHTAPRIVLEELVRAVAPSASASRFADMIVERRAERDLSEQDILEAATSSEVPEGDRAKLKSMFTIEASFWRIEATLKDRSGETVMKQGGLANGMIKSGLLGTNNSWSIITWGIAPPDEKEKK